MSGIQATGAIGTLGVVNGASLQLTGIGSNAFIGTLLQSRTIGLTGLSGASGAGRQISFVLSSNSATGYVGILTPSITKTISGNQAASASGVVTAASGTGLLLTGVSSTGAVGALGKTVVLSLPGVGSLTAKGDVSASSPTGVNLVGQQSSSAIGSMGVNVTRAIPGIQGTSVLGVSVPGNTLALIGSSSVSATGTLINDKYTIRVSWSASIDPGVTGYFVGIDTVSRSGTTTITSYATVVDVAGTTYTFRNLYKGTFYYINITSHGVGGHDQFESLPFGELQLTANLELRGNSATASIGQLGVQNILSLIGGGAIGQRGTVSAAASGGSTSLSGVVSSGFIGQLTPSITASITGTSSTAATGIIVPGLAMPLPGRTSAANVGTAVPTTDVGMYGNAAFPGYGAVTFSVAGDKFVGLTGQDANANAGVSSLELSVGITGVQASASIGTLGVSRGGSVSLTGVSARGETGNIFVPSTPSGGAENIDEVILSRRRRGR